MTEIENHFTVFIRLPFNRGEFVDPPPVAWSAAKERQLWDVISRQGQGKGNEIDWNALAAQFEVTQPFILQQAAWLYERQLSQVRAQLRKVGNRPSATPSPAPGSLNSSMVGGQPMKRAGSGGSRVPSRLSTQHVGSPVAGGEASTPPTPAKSRTSLPLRNPSVAAPVPGRTGSLSSRPLSRQPSREAEQAQSHSRRGSTQNPLSRSPGQEQANNQAQDSDEDNAAGKPSVRRVNPSAIHRRIPSYRKEQTPSPKPQFNIGDDEDEDSPTFLPFVAEQSNEVISPTSRSGQDPGATIRGGYAQSAFQRPTSHRRSTSERIIQRPQEEEGQNVKGKQKQMSSSTSSDSNPAVPLRPTTHPPTVARASRNPSSNALSPRQQAALASVGLSPRRHGSESSPSMGSSFSDLDDASVTQSALEEALMSNLGNTTATVGGGMASRVSGISQALRSRYFDARGQPQGQQREGER